MVNIWILNFEKQLPDMHFCGWIFSAERSPDNIQIYMQGNEGEGAIAARASTNVI